MLDDPGRAFANCRVDAALRRLAHDLKCAGIDSPDRDARLLAAAALGATRETLVSNPERRLLREEAHSLAAFRARRLAREPVSRILGYRHFYGRPFRITPATLDPRPETETVVDCALAIAREEGWMNRPIRIVDAGTGSGCLLLTLLAELPLATGLGTDICPEALAVAVRNAEHMQLKARARFEQRRGLKDVTDSFDLLVSNPPYIARHEIDALPREVKDFDPLMALDGGPDGLDIYRCLAGDLQRVLQFGWAIFEVGAGQHEAVADILMRRDNDTERGGIKLTKDLGGHVRCVALRSHS